MKESYREDIASHSGLEPYAGGGDLAGVASARGSTGQPLSSDITSSVCRSCPVREKATPLLPLDGKAEAGTAESENLRMCRHLKRENREILFRLRFPLGKCPGRRNGQETFQTVQLT